VSTVQEPLNLTSSYVGAWHGSEAYKHAERLIKHNNLSKIVSVHHSKVETLQLDEQVDIIVSEWMGKFLIKEGMLSSVLWARNRLLNPHTGIVFPQHASLYVSFLGHDVEWMFSHQQATLSSRMRSFEDLCHISRSEFNGLDFCGPLLETYTNSTRQFLFNNYFRQDLLGGDLAGEASLLADYDLKTQPAWTLNREQVAHLSFQFNKTSASKVCGIAGWFRVDFPGETAVSLDTAPGSLAESTHWGQTVFLFPDGCVDLSMEEDCNILSATVRARMNSPAQPRTVNVSVELNARCPPNKDITICEDTTPSFSMPAPPAPTVQALDAPMPTELSEEKVRELRARRKRAAAKLQEARDTAKLASLYSEPWDETVEQQLRHVNFEGGASRDIAATRRSDDDNSATPLERWKHVAPSPMPLTHESGSTCTVHWTMEHSFVVGDVEHSLRPPSFARGVDTNRDGQLDPQEIVASLDISTDDVCEGSEHNTCSSVLSLLDTDSDGIVSYAEFDDFVRVQGM